MSLLSLFNTYSRARQAREKAAADLKQETAPHQKAINVIKKAHKPEIDAGKVREATAKVAVETKAILENVSGRYTFENGGWIQRNEQGRTAYVVDIEVFLASDFALQMIDKIVLDQNAVSAFRALTKQKDVLGVEFKTTESFRYHVVKEEKAE